MEDTLRRVLQKLERAVRNGERLHLDAHEAVALYRSPAGAQLATLAYEEAVSRLSSASSPQAAETTPPAPASADLNDLVAEAEMRQANETANRIKSRLRRKRPPVL